MTSSFEIPLSVVITAAGSVESFDHAVADYIAAMETHSHTTEGEPAPTAPPLVERAVLRVQQDDKPDMFVPNYKIIDDTPPPPTLEQRKGVLVQAAHAAAEAAIALFYPPLKRRLWQMTVARANQVDEVDRTPTDKAAIAHAADISVRSNAIEFHLAEVEAEIHDLTADTIDGWEMAPFPA